VTIEDEVGALAAAYAALGKLDYRTRMATLTYLTTRFQDEEAARIRDSKKTAEVTP
jgi:hypothetical protein